MAIFKVKAGRVSAEVNTARFESQYKKAQQKLNMMVVADSTPHVPIQQGQLRSQVRYPEGLSGEIIEWYAPYAHYQYSGEVLTDEKGRTYVEAGTPKTVHTGRALNYHEPDTGDHWFEKAKQENGKKWIDTVKRIAGGGK